MLGILLTVFVVGYVLITMEHSTKINKTAPALITGVLCWVIYAHFNPDKTELNFQLIEHLGDVSSILFFLLGAMTIIELIDANDGFDIITDRIKQRDKRRLLWIIGFLTFFMSAILDNLTTTIIMVSLLRKLVFDKQDRMLFVGIIIIAANAGGAWTPIGDVTTTMLWIGGQITTANIMTKLFVPSLVALVIPLIAVSLTLKGSYAPAETLEALPNRKSLTKIQKKNILALGILSLISVPVFKYFTHLPPFMGILLGLGVLWVVTEFMQRRKSEEEIEKRTLIYALKKVDMTSILFFLGILMAVAALESSGALNIMATKMNETLGDIKLIVFSIGILSSIVDNVPLVAAAQGMYSLAQYPMDHYMWELLAFCAGTGGSILIIGSAAGVAAMGMEKISFFWYVKKISWLALLGYVAGVVVYLGLLKI